MRLLITLKRAFSYASASAEKGAQMSTLGCCCPTVTQPVSSLSAMLPPGRRARRKSVADATCGTAGALHPTNAHTTHIKHTEHMHRMSMAVAREVGKSHSRGMATCFNHTLMHPD